METTPEIKKNSIFPNALNYGKILGIISIIFTIILYVLNIMDNKYAGFVPLIILIAVLVVGILNYRNKINGGFITYGQSLGTGVLIGLISSVLVALFTFILYQYIDPDLIGSLLSKTEEQMLERNPNLTDEQIEMAVNYTKKYTTPLWLTISAFFWTTLLAFIASLVISIFTQKKDKSFESNFR